MRLRITVMLGFICCGALIVYSRSSAVDEVGDKRLPSQRPLNVLIQELVDYSEPEMGHYTEAELALIERREESLPIIIQMMTDEDWFIRARCYRVLSGISQMGFGWRIDKGVDEWREDEFGVFWVKLGDYVHIAIDGQDEEIAKNNRRKAQRLWRQYSVLLMDHGKHVGEMDPNPHPSTPLTSKPE